MEINFRKVALLWLVLAGIFWASAAPAQPPPRQFLRNQVPAAVSRLNPTGRLPATDRLQLAIGLPLRNTNELDELLKEIYFEPASGNYRRFLTTDEFTRRFGPTEQDYQQVIAFARANHFTVTGTHPNRMLLDVEASVPDIEKVLHVTLRIYRHPRAARNFFAPDVEPSLELSTPVLNISGLDNFTIPQALNHERKLGAKAAGAVPQSGSGPGGNFVGLDFRAAYVPGTTLNGAGQSVGLVQFSGYYPADILSYQLAYGLSTNTPLVNVLLDSVSSITNGATGMNAAEPPLDIEMTISMATNLNSVITYYGTDKNDIMNRIATDNLAKQISASWTFGVDNTTLQIFQQFAAQGQSYFNASGDSDAYTGSPSSPTDAPYVTSVGGTTLTTSGGAWSSEKAWNWNNNNTGNFGTSGGASTTYSMPFWQQGVSMGANQGSTTMRNIPDVALTADNILVNYKNGFIESVGGTSCASPLWAGFMALVNQQAAANGFPPVGFINPAVYAIGTGANFAATFHDITTGNNTNSSSPTKFFAVTGYDLCTGWGTPNGTNLINALAIPDALAVTPANGFVTGGAVGGPFNPTNLIFALTNLGTASLNWSATSTSSWLNVSATNGSLAAGGVTNITATVNSTATNLAAGYYPATVFFTNLASGIFQTRQFTLVVGLGLTWNNNANTVAPHDGSGTWINQSAGNTTWWNGAGNVQWNNNAPSLATFGANFGAAGTVTLGGAITAGGINFNAPGSGSYTIAGSGTLTLNGNLNANVSATINAPVTLGLPSTFTVANSQTLTVTNILAGSSANNLTIAGPGTVSLTGQNNSGTSGGMGGFVNVNSGTLSVNSGNTAYGTLGNVAGITVAAGATLSLQNFNALSGYFGVARNVTLNGGTLNAVSGNHLVDILTLNGGTVSGTGSAMYGSINLVNNCYVTTNSTISAQNFTTGNANRNFIVSSNATLAFSGTIINGNGNTSSFTLAGGGTMLLTAVNTLTGGVTNNGGTLQLNPGGNGGNSISGLLGSVSGITINSGATLSTLGTNAISGSGGSPRAITINGGTLNDDVGNHAIASLTLNGGTVSGAGNATLGSYNLNGNCTVTSNSVISAQNFTTLTSSIFNVSTNVTLAIPGSITGNGGLVLAGGGNIVMSGTNSYLIGTTVSNGTLEVDGVLGDSVTIVKGTLAGVGRISRSVTVRTNSFFSPGTNGVVGTLTISNRLSLAGTTLMLLNRTNAPSSTQVLGISTLTNGGALTVSNLGPALQNGDSLTLFSATNYTGNFSSVILPALGAGLGWDKTMLAPAGIISVAQLPSVNITPAATNVECGGSLTLTAAVTGAPPFVFQWFDYQTNAIPGATNLSLTLTNLHLAQAGNYSLVATNNCGTGSASATILVTDTTPPVVTLNGTNPVMVECHGAFIDPGATANDICAGSLGVTTNGSVNVNSPGSYTLTYIATDSSGNSNSVSRTVNVVDTTPPAILRTFTNLVLTAGTNCTAAMPNLTGTNFILAADACSASLTISQTPVNGTTLSIGTNAVTFLVDDGNGNTNSSAAQVIVQESLPQFISQPQSLTNHFGTAASFSVAASACSALSFQWLFNNAPISGQTNTVLALAAVNSCNAGNYQAVATSGSGSVTSLVAVLTVINDPTNISPAGALNVGVETDCTGIIFNPGNSYAWEISDALTNWDLLVVNGLLDVESSATNPFTVKIISITSSNTPGLAGNFMGTSNYIWTIASATAGISNFNAASFAVDASAFSNAVSGTFGVAQSGTNLVVQYTAPLVVPAPVAITGGTALGNGTFQLSFTGPASQPFRILSTTNLLLPLTNWTPLTTGSFSGGVINYTDATATNQLIQFYRVAAP